MMLSPRLIQLFTILLREEGIVSVKKLAEDVRVSKRTVQRELDNTEGFFAEIWLKPKYKGRYRYLDGGREKQ